MADLVTPSVSALAGVAAAGQRLGRRAGPAGVTVAEVTGLGIASLAVRSGQADALQERIRTALGLDLPGQGKSVASDGARALWTGPGQWLIQFSGGRQRVAALARDLEGLAAVVDQSDSRAVLEVNGRHVREALAKGLMIDLHPRAFAVGDTAVTLAGHVGVQVTLLDDRPAFQLTVARSYSLSLWEWLITAAATFGIAVVSPEMLVGDEGKSFDLE